MAETRETQVIEDVINGDEISNPRTTEEAILAQVIAGEEVTINARTRMQYWLSQLKSGGGGEDIYKKVIISGEGLEPVNVEDLQDYSQNWIGMSAGIPVVSSAVVVKIGNLTGLGGGGAIDKSENNYHYFAGWISSTKVELWFEATFQTVTLKKMVYGGNDVTSLYGTSAVWNISVFSPV